MNVTNEMVKSAMDAFNDNFVMGIPDYFIPDMQRAIEAAIQTAWVSVNERLPEKQETVIVRTKFGEVGSDLLHCTETVCWYKDGSHGNITHWMPLPEYKGD
jgi:hypothetical protein